MANCVDLKMDSKFVRGDLAFIGNIMDKKMYLYILKQEIFKYSEIFEKVQ